MEIPRLEDRAQDFTADPVELFFDLAYVFAFSQLVGFLINEPSWGGVGKAALLFGLLWLPWQQLTWAANTVEGFRRKIRLILLVATVLSVPMAASTSTALDAGGLVFALSLGGIMLLGFLMQTLDSPQGTELWDAIVWWIAPNLVAIVVLIAGALAEGPLRIGLWLVNLAIVLGAMIAAGRGEWLIRVGHMAERHGLIVIIALGEVIVAIGIPVVTALQDGDGLPGATTAALVASGAFAGLLWWGYFDRPGPNLEERGTELASNRERGRYARDVYTWAHAPIVAGIMLAAAALEAISLHPLERVAPSFRLMLVFGLVLFLGGIAIAVWRAFRTLAAERVVGAAAVAGVMLLGATLNGVTLLTLVVAVLLGSLIVEHYRFDRTGSHVEASPEV